MHRSALAPSSLRPRPADGVDTGEATDTAVRTHHGGIEGPHRGRTRERGVASPAPRPSPSGHGSRVRAVPDATPLSSTIGAAEFFCVRDTDYCVSNSGSVRILHVDDDPEFAELAVDMLEREDEGFDIDTATSAAAALDRLADADYDCIVSDYDMPGRNGIDFLNTVREGNPDLPFVLYTGKGSEEVASEAISAGVTDYLQKGTGTSQYAVLANRVRNAVEKYRAQTELADRERRLNLFFEQSPLGVVEWNEEFELIRVNDAASGILGYDEDELTGRSWEAIVPDSDREAVADVVSALLDDRAGYHSINENVRGDGDRVVCEWHNRVVTDDDDEVVAIFSQFQDITDRRRRRRRFEAVFNNTHTLTGLMDPDGTMIEANDTALSFGGLDRDDVVGKRLWNTPWVRPDDDARAMAREAVERARDGDVFQEEVRIRGSDREATIDFSVRPVTDDRGEVKLLVPEGRDITESVEQERESDRRRRRLEQILKTVPACVVQLNAAGEFVFANDRAEEVLGLDPDTVTERAYNDPEWNIKDLDGDPIPDDGLPFRRVCDTGEPLSDARHVIEWPDGTQKILLVNGTPLFDDDGAVETVIFALTDVTDEVVRKRRLEATLENTTAPLFMKDRDGEYLLVNRGWRRLFGLEHAEVRGRTDADLFPTGMAEEVRTNDRRVLETGEPAETEERIVVDGEERTFLASKTPVHDIGTESDPEDPVAVFGVANDITEQKQRESRLKRQNDRFDTLASAVSHDLQTPLATARGRAELAVETGDVEQMRRALDAIERTDELRENLVEVLRTRAVVDGTEPVDVGRLGRAAWNTVPTPEDVSFRLRSEFSVEADPDALRRLFENLLSNAVEHGDGNRTVRVGRTDGGFYVEDDGPGIPESEREEAFTPGYSTKPDGDGVGLASVQQVATAHGWDIRVADGPDGGARFELSNVDVVDD